MDETYDPLPGTPEAEDPRIEIDEFLTVMKDATSGLREIITEDIQSDIGAARVQSELSQSMILGDINGDINSAGKLAGKAHSNINKDIATDVDDAAASVIRMGFTIPAPDAQAYANRTNNYIAVVGGEPAVRAALAGEEPPPATYYGLPEEEQEESIILAPVNPEIPPSYIPNMLPPHQGGFWATSCGDGYAPVYNDGVWIYCIPIFEYTRIYGPSTPIPTPTAEPVPPYCPPTHDPVYVPYPVPYPVGGTTEPTPTTTPATTTSTKPKPTQSTVEPLPTAIKTVTLKTGNGDKWELPGWPDLNGPDACIQVRAWLENIRHKVITVAAFLPTIPITIPAGVGYTVAKEVLGVIGVNIGEDGAITILGKIFDWIDGVFESAAKSAGFRADLAIQPLVYRGVMNFLQRWLGDFCPEIVAFLTHAINTLIPSHLPTQDEANRMRVTDTISNAEWECLTKLNGSYDYWQLRKMISDSSKPNVGELIDMWRRKIITAEQCDVGLASLGFTNAGHRNNIMKLAESYPPFQDVIRMMVRDVADAETVERFRMDSGFEQKWAQPLKYYGEAQGITDDVAKLYWRAHWHLPSPTALYEMLHRLRPGRVPNNQETTANDVRKALEIDDMLPFWIDRMVAISYRPITRVDTQRAYELGTFDEAEVTARYQDMGYSPADAATLTRYSTDLKRSRRNRRLGMPTGATLRARYVKYLIDADELSEQLQELQYTEAEIATLIRWGDRERKANTRKAVYACTKTKFLKGLVDAGTAMSDLVRAGFRANDVGVIVGEWCKVAGVKERYLTASQLCDYWQKGLLTQAEFGAGLIRLGYDASSANRIMMACGIELAEDQAKELEKAAKEAAREQARREREAKKAQDAPQ